MIQSDGEFVYRFEESNELFESFINKDYIPKELQKILLNSDVLIVPSEGFRDINEPLFPVGTEELYRYLLTNGLSVDICISDEDYKELALHGNLKRLGEFAIKKVALPVFIGVMITFLSNEVITKNNEKEIKITITVIDSTKSKRLEFEGPANKFIEISDDIKKNFWINNE